MEQERRRAVRHPVPSRVEGTVTAEIATALVDVSATGALVEHLHTMRPGYLYRVRFVAPETAVDLTCRAIRSFVVRAEPRGEAETELVYRTGLEFIEPDAGAITRLLAATRA
ncbi:MAG: PilZ domain-containing protein [candidate division NC10 bacterium]|nr:PilZ domain-containing protein [candidate division NC10 bacterium]